MNIDRIEGGAGVTKHAGMTTGYHRIITQGTSI